VIDQAALHGVLKKVRDLGLTLISVRPLEQVPSYTPETSQADPSDVKIEDTEP
jgi:hypothetical protein